MDPTKVESGILCNSRPHLDIDTDLDESSKDFSKMEAVFVIGVDQMLIPMVTRWLLEIVVVFQIHIRQQ